MKNQSPFKYCPPRRVIDRKQNIFNLIVRLEDKHHVTAREIKFALGTALWNDFKREEIASCPEKLSPVINRQLAKYSRALYRADRLHARWKQVQQRAFMIYRGKKLPVSVAKALYCREVCKQYEIALENLRDLLAKNHILSHYFDLPVLGEVFDDIAHEYESMPRFWDTLPQMNREIQQRPYRTFTRCNLTLTRSAKFPEFYLLSPKTAFTAASDSKNSSVVDSKLNINVSTSFIQDIFEALQQFKPSIMVN
jgi:hypothetical protein